jgi:hypothetical protein
MSFTSIGGTHVSRYFARLRLAHGLRPGQLAAALGASNISKVGSLIRQFELYGEISPHWLDRLSDFLHPDRDELQQQLDLDRQEEERLREKHRRAWEEWADQPVHPYLTIRYMPAIYGCREVPKGFCNNREQAEGWAEDELKRFGARGFLNWTRREQTTYQKGGSNPRRHTASYTEPPATASMQALGRSTRFLLSSSGAVTRGYGLEQPL